MLRLRQSTPGPPCSATPSAAAAASHGPRGNNPPAREPGWKGVAGRVVGGGVVKDPVPVALVKQ